MARSVFLIAGEPSGDQHAAELFRALKRARPELEGRGLGGQAMAAAGVEIRADLAADAVMGLFPVLAALPRIRAWFRLAEEELRRDPPEALILIDYPGFNLRMAEVAKGLGIPVVYYIAPQAWAWKEGRVKKMRRLIDLLIVILPFEARWFSERGMAAYDCGHPLMDRLAKNLASKDRRDALRQGAKTVLGLFPGSRPHVVKSLAADFLKTAKIVESKIPAGLRVLVAAGDENMARIVTEFLPLGPENVEIVTGDSFAVMAAADACLTTSGTTTLEIAGHRKPMTIAYKVSPLVHAIGKRLVKVDAIGLVNLVAETQVVPEVIGSGSLVEKLSPLVVASLAPGAQESFAKRMDDEVFPRLGPVGSYERAAKKLLEFLAARD